MKTFQEQVSDLQATRESKMVELKAVAQKAADESRTLDTGETEQCASIQAEIKQIDSSIATFTQLADMDKATVKAVSDDEPRNVVDRAPVRAKHVEKLEPGIAFARYAMCLTAAKGNHAIASQLAQKHYPHTESINQVLKAQSEGYNLPAMLQMKATVAAGTTTESTWANPLVYAETFMGDFIDYLRPRTLIGQAQFRPVPFNVRIGGQTSGGTANWVGQGKGKPVTKFDYTSTTIPFTKIAAIAVITQELARFSSPSAEMLVRDSLADSVIAKVDSDLFDPDVAAVANTNPAGLLNGVAPLTTIALNGVDYGDPDTIRAAIAALWVPWDSTYLGARPAYYTTPAVARQLSLSREALGTPAFPGMTMMGGNIGGVPVRVSQYLANNGGSGGAPFILVDESEIYLADDGAVTLDASEQASIEMNDAPTQVAGTPTASTMVSMWQTNSIAFRAERFIWWGARRTGACQWFDGFPVA